MRAGSGGRDHAGAFICASGVMLSTITLNTSFAWLFAAYAVFGIGFGVVNAPITNTALSGMPDSQAGVAAAVASTSRQIGQVLGVAALGALAAAAVQGNRASELPSASHPALVGHLGLWPGRPRSWNAHHHSLVGPDGRGRGRPFSRRSL